MVRHSGKKVNEDKILVWFSLKIFIEIIKKENNNTKRLAYTALARPILEYGAV